MKIECRKEAQNAPAPITNYALFRDGEYVTNEQIFNCKKADDIYFEQLAEGVRHFKETAEGRDAMCESFEKLADKVADQREERTKVDLVKALMETMKLNLEQSLNALKIQGKDRAVIAKQLQK